MGKFKAIEGLRGWLAWVVVLSHLTTITCVYVFGIGPVLEHAGGCAVIVFVIISGFVITHLVETRPEAYPVYLVRRFMRIFPLFAVTCIFGFFTYDILANQLVSLPWANNPVYGPASQIAIAHSDHAYFWQHVLAHLTMLHGAIGNNFLPNSEYAFNGPAWSLSLEWQFYLVAPFAVVLAHRRGNLVPMALILFGLGALCQMGLFGKFDNTSFLPGMAGYFAIGILTRLHYDEVVRTARAYRACIVPLVLVLLPLHVGLVPLLVWLVVLCGLPLSGAEERDDRFMRIYRRLLESPVALYFGSRSYSVYLCHYLVIDVCYAFWLRMFPVAPDATTSFWVTGPAMLAMTAMTVPVTIAFSELLYRGVEIPGIRLGSHLASNLQSWLSRRGAAKASGSLNLASGHGEGGESIDMALEPLRRDVRRGP